MNMTERNYLHSRPLDVHRWSEHPEVNIFVDTIYNNDFRQGNENQRIKKKHLKLVLLDLYLLGQVGFLEMLCGWVGRYKQLTVNN